MLASWAMSSKRKGVDGPLRFLKRFLHTEAFCFFTDGLVDCSIASLTGWGKSTIDSPYCFKCDLSERAFNVGDAFMSVAKVDSSSPELVREATSSSFSLVEIPYIAGGCFSLLFMTIIHYWLLTVSRWIYIVSPLGVGTRTRPFSF